MLLPLATTKQFHSAVRAVIHSDRFYGKSYTDGTYRHDVGDKRYVMHNVMNITEDDVKNVEFVLWSQGVTANTRLGYSAIRGTCLISKKK
jgi:hypothetical protein